jgi:CRISPR-associated protein Cmr1
MKKLEYQVSFATPAFLGNADQNGQWRTPPFKALLRQWWRVAYAAEQRFTVKVTEIRREEGLLFGNAWLSHQEGNRDVADHRKSLVRIRLDRWDEGKLKSWQPLATVGHPEVRFPVGSDLYLGYGPVTLPRGSDQPKLKSNAAIQVGESAKLSIAIPSTHQDAGIRQLLETNAPRIERALWLMDRYGTLGGRSRNGWGSFALRPLLQAEEGWGEGALPSRPWRDCLALDWPHAIGQDEKGALIWQTNPFDDWKSLMRELAIVKIGLRTQFKFPDAQPPHPQPLERHWLSYPVTRHSTKAFDRNARLPNSLRFKVRKLPDGKLVGVVFHVPCLPPPEFKPDRNAIQAMWKNVHALLDELARPTTERAYRSVADAARRTQLKPSLDTLTLQRISE